MSEDTAVYFPAEYAEYEITEVPRPVQTELLVQILKYSLRLSTRFDKFLHGYDSKACEKIDAICEKLDIAT